MRRAFVPYRTCDCLHARCVESRGQIVATTNDGDGDAEAGEAERARRSARRSPGVARCVDPDDGEEAPRGKREQGVDRCGLEIRGDDDELTRLRCPRLLVDEPARELRPCVGLGGREDAQHRSEALGEGRHLDDPNRPRPW